MSGSDNRPVWAAGDRYEPYVGGGSRLFAALFRRWVGVAVRRKRVANGVGQGAGGFREGARVARAEMAAEGTA